MALIGQAEVIIDAKARLAVPAKFRAAAPSAEEGERANWIVMPRADGTLWIYPEPAFEQLAESHVHSLSPEDDEAELNRVLFGYSERVTMDGAHRLTLPRKHLELTGLSGEVTVVGAMNHLEVHSREQWTARESERLARLPQLSAKARQLARGEGR